MPIKIFKKSTNKKFYFTVEVENGIVVVTSQEYASKSALYVGIISLCRITFDYSGSDILDIPIKEI